MVIHKRTCIQLCSYKCMNSEFTYICSCKQSADLGKPIISQSWELWGSAGMLVSLPPSSWGDYCWLNMGKGQSHIQSTTYAQFCFLLHIHSKGYRDFSVYINLGPGSGGIGKFFFFSQFGSFHYCHQVTNSSSTWIYIVLFCALL